MMTMAIQRKVTQFFKDFKGGVNLSQDGSFTPVVLAINELLRSKNAFDRGGLQKRKGMSKFVSPAVAASTPIVGLHRFYRAGITPQLLAAAGDSIYVYNESTAAWDVLKTGLTISDEVVFTTYGPTSKVLIANGLDTPMIYDGTSITDYTAAPAKAKNFIIHRDRIFSYSNNLTLSYSDNLDINTWSAAPLTLATSDPVITASIVHNQNTADSSVVSQLLVFTANSTWILVGTNFTTLSDIVFHQISGDIGTLSPKSVVRTPRGVMFFGSQGGRKNTFLVVGEGIGAKVVPVGDKIRQVFNAVPLSSLPSLVGVYNDGYYRISYRPPGTVSNTEEWWLRVEDLTARSIAWFGPMVRSIGLRSITNISGSFDNTQLIAGGETGFVYLLDSTENDDGVSIDVDIKTGFYDFGQFNKEKRVLEVFVNIQASNGSVTVSTDTDFGTTQSNVLTLDAIGGSFPYVFPFTFPRVSTNLKTVDFTGNAVTGIYHALQIAFSSLTESFLLNTLSVTLRVDNQEKQEE